MQSIQDLIRAEKKRIEAEASANLRAIKPEMGKHVYRILPSWRDDGSKLFFHRFGQHFIKDSSGKTQALYLCLDATFGEDCPVCRAIGEGIRNATDDATIKLLKEANAKKRYYVNALHRSSADPDTPKLMELPLSVFTDIAGIIDDYGDITDPNEGFDMIIERTGSGLNTEYRVTPAPKSLPVDKKSLTGLTNIDAVVTPSNDTKLNGALNALAAIRGIDRVATPALAAPAASARTAPAAELAVEADFSEVSDAELESIEDDFDSMLEDFADDLDGKAA